MCAAGRHQGVTTTSPRVTCAEPGSGQAAHGKSIALITTASHPRPIHRRPLCHVPKRAPRIFLECRAGNRRHRVSPAPRDAPPYRRGGVGAASRGGRRDRSRVLAAPARSRRRSSRRTRWQRGRATAQARAARCRDLAFHPRHAMRPEGSRRSKGRAARLAPARPRSRCAVPRRDNAGGMHSAPAAAGIVAARTVSCPPAATSATSQPLAMARGGSSKRASRVRMRAEGSIAVHRQPGVRSAGPSWPPPAPTSSRSPVSPTPGGRAVQRAPRSRRCRYRLHRTRADRSVRMRRRRRPGSRDWAADRGQDQSRRARRYLRQRSRHRELPPLAPYRFTVRCDRSGNIRTPRPMRSRVTAAVAGLLARGSSPPTTFPRAAFSVALWSEARRLQLRGQPRHCATSARTAFPFDPLREPPPTILSSENNSVNILDRCDRRIVSVVVDQPHSCSA